LAKERAQYDQERRPERHAFYSTALWQKTRKMKLAEQPICEVCNNALATQVHHLVPIESRMDLALTMTNLQSICQSCHSSITAKENRQQGKW